MLHEIGVFWGFREAAPPLSGGMRMWVLHPPQKELRLEYWHWDLLGPIPFQYENYKGYAEDDYPDDFQLFPFQSRLIIATIRDAPAYLRLTYDGITEQPERRFDIGFARIEAARGFKIRNAEPGRACTYQMIPMR